MSDKRRGKVVRVEIQVAYPGGGESTRVIEGHALDQLAIIAFSEDAIKDYLGSIKDHEHALRIYRDGYAGEDRGKPAVLILNADGTYRMECDWLSHHRSQD